jgi:hypothetical protein
MESAENNQKNKAFEKFTIVTVKRSEIRLASYNPRLITDDARKKLKENIKRVGLLDPIIVNKTTMNVVSGHQRLQVLDQLNGKKDDYDVTVSMVELDEKTEKEQNVFMNNPFGQGEFDQVKLPDLLKEINADFAGFELKDIYQSFGENALKDSPEALKEMSKVIDDFSERMISIKEKTTARDSDLDYYLVLVFKNYDHRKEFTDRVGLEDNMFVDQKELESKIRALPS